MNHINILYTVNENYFKHMLVSMYSLIENNQDLDINFHILADNLKKDSFLLAEKIISRFNNTNIFFYDFNNINNLIEEYNLPTWRNTNIANGRIFFNEYIKNVDKLLYLDSDTIIVNSLKKLSKYNDTVHMVKDSIFLEHLNKLDIPVKSYYNSGVIWIDVEKWNKEKCNKSIIDTLKNCSYYKFPDQDLLNMALKDNIKPLHPKYNLFAVESYFNKFFLKRYYKQNNIQKKSINRIDEAKNNPTILHGTPFYFWRPWDYNSIHPHKDVYNEYLNKIFTSKHLCNSKVSKELLYKLFINSSLLCPPNVKSKVKKIIRK